jgi:hypothetical protein
MSLLSTILGGRGDYVRSQINAMFANVWKAMQIQDANAFTTTGTAPNFLGVSDPVITAYATNMRYRVKVHANGTTGSNTLNICGLGAKNLKCYNMAGNKVPAILFVGMLLDCEFDGTDFIVLNPINYNNSLIGIQCWATAGSYAYVPTSGTASVRAKVQGAGGAGGGAPATAAGQVGLGLGGSAGAYGESRLTSGITGITITVGAGGTGVTGGVGNNGGTSSFGALISAPGGVGGPVLGPSAPPYMPQGGATSSVATGGNILNTPGAAAGVAYSNSVSSFAGSSGGHSLFAPGGPIPAPNISGNAGRFGSGGSGTTTTASAGALMGGRGGDGYVVVEEYA